MMINNLLEFKIISSGAIPTLNGAIVKKVNNNFIINDDIQLTFEKLIELALNGLVARATKIQVNNVTYSTEDEYETGNVLFFLFNSTTNSWNGALTNGIRLELPALKKIEMTKAQRISQIEKIINMQTPSPVRIQGILKKRTESPIEFLNKFFTEWNDEKNTIFVDTKEVQTESGKRRSLGDIYMIMKYYYPALSLLDVIDLMYVKLINNYTCFRTSYCNTIKRRVWYHQEGGGGPNHVYNKESKDEFGFNWQQIMNLLK